MSRFLPFIGRQYEDSIYGARVMILGLSHYGDPEDAYPEFTRDVINENAYSPGNRFFTLLTNLLRLSKDAPDDTERRAAWEQVAFYNYIQDIVGITSRISPTPEMWDEARQPFLNVVKELKPQIIIVLGTQLWDQLPEIDGIEWCWVKHPSSGSFSYDEAFSNFKKALENIRK
ncbi:uracil-DNA glycosylase family protein [Morganella morganii]|uniref:uracil-DNA glycosylase family protein n=2 Tax=Morganella morganii TaxID=582 RepID=UPI0016519DB9|nr:uracil-DNA glycosylase family protein [Morganella morganii]MBV7313270.1 uracil-DNA glycosylase family protein [Morganella morganii]